jgi:hypothetical protein
MSALLEDNNIINNFNNINLNKVDTSTSLKIGEDNNSTSNRTSFKITKESAKNYNPSKKELEFMDILKEKVIKRAKALSYNDNNFNNALILDLGASEHYTPYKDILLDYKPVNNKSVIIANGVKLPIKGIGHIPIFINKDTFLIKNVNYVPNIKITLISLKELTNKGWEILFKEDIAVLSYNNKIITKAN